MRTSEVHLLNPCLNLAPLRCTDRYTVIVDTETVVFLVYRHQDI
jgi:sRNA-binding regulator protein Hfq